VKLNFNPFNAGNPMTFKEACIVSAISATAVMILNTVANATFGQVQAAPLEFLFNCGKTWLVAWAGNFITLTGLEQLVKKVKSEG